jgi:hypothetical protein
MTVNKEQIQDRPGIRISVAEHAHAILTLDWFGIKKS